MTNSGLRTIDYASGRTSRIEVAARRAIMTAVTQVGMRQQDLRIRYGRDECLNGIEIMMRIIKFRIWKNRVYL